MVFTIVSEQRVQVADLADGDADRILALVRDHPPEQVAERTGLAAEAIRTLARSFADPAHGPGRSLAVGGGIAASGDHATTAQVAINLLNYVAGNVGTTVVFGPDGDVGWDGASSYREMVELADAMRTGEIDVAILLDVNPVYTMPGGANFAEALANVPFVVSTASCPDETASRADLVLPTHTPLESWGDVESRAGVHGLMQPTMQPRLDTKHLGDLLLETGRALGHDVASGWPPEEDFLTLLRREWAALRPVQTADREAEDAVPAPNFNQFWAESQQRGGTWQSVDPVAVDLHPNLFGTSFEVPPGDDTRVRRGQRRGRALGAQDDLPWDVTCRGVVDGIALVIHMTPAGVVVRRHRRLKTDKVGGSPIRLDKVVEAAGVEFLTRHSLNALMVHDFWT